jgi:adenylate kinase family enzyme
MRLKPSLVCLFEQTEQVSVQRLANRRVDPVTGIEWNLEGESQPDEAVSGRLQEIPEDKEEAVKKRFAHWTANLSLMEETYKQVMLNVQSDKTSEQINELVCDAI